MVVAAIAPGPTAGEFEDGELLARQELGSRLALARRRGKNEGRTRAALPDERAGVVRREELAGEGHIGEVAALGVDARVEDQGGAGETETLRCAGGTILVPWRRGGAGRPTRSFVRRRHET